MILGKHTYQAINLKWLIVKPVAKNVNLTESIVERNYIFLQTEILWKILEVGETQIQPIFITFHVSLMNFD